uniref:DNA-binding protein n=1 Tax=Candidatus Caldatribacterium saccharofermentans TaxID=1454753 RepID=A0A7V4TZ32_9BACT
MSETLADLPEVLTSRDLLEVLPIGKNTLYRLLHRADFPARRVGRKFLVSKRALLRWLEERNDAR